MENNGTPQNQKDTQKKSSYLKYIIPAIIIPLFIIAFFIYFSLRWEPKPDPTTEIVFRKAAAAQLWRQINLKKNPNELTDEDFSKITELRINDEIIGDIGFLKKFTNLQSLQLGNIQYPENAIPEWMKILNKLGLYDYKKRITFDLNSLGNLNGLKNIEFIEIPVRNLAPLANLINLRGLRLSNTKVTNFKPIKNLTNLQFLAIQKAQIRDLNPIKNLINLRELEIKETPITDLNPIKKLKNLEKFRIIYCDKIKDEQLKDLAKSLPKLKIMDYSFELE